MDKPWWVLILRWVLFLSIVGGGIVFLAHYQQGAKEGKVAGVEVSAGKIPLVKKVVKVIPPRWKEKAVQELDTLVKKKKEENPWIKDVEKKVNQVELQITQFPHQSKKEMKKQLIREACQELLREVDHEK